MTLTVEPPATDASYFALLMERIEEGSRDAEHELYLYFFRGIKYLLARHLGPDRSEDLAQDVFDKVTGAIRNGEVGEPKRLAGFVRMAVHREIASHADAPQPRTEASRDREGDLGAADVVLRSLPPKQREALIRFYAQGQPAEKICRELGLTAAQFRAIRNRAKDNFFVRPECAY